MTKADLEDALIAWGRVYGQGRFDLAEERSLTGDSTLSRIMGRPKQESTVGRDGRERRTYMAAGRGMVPMWAVDHVPCTGTRTPGRHYDMRETPTVGLIQAAWLTLYRTSQPLADAVRLHYQRRDIDRDQRAKEAGMTVRGYRDCVSRGRCFIQAYMG